MFWHYILKVPIQRKSDFIVYKKAERDMDLSGNTVFDEAGGRLGGLTVRLLSTKSPTPSPGECF